MRPIHPILAKPRCEAIVKGIAIRELKDPEEFEQAVEVQYSAWRMKDYREAVPAHMLKALADTSGLLLGAFDTETGELIGMAIGFYVCSNDGKKYLYSHMVGVKEGLKYKGVGYRLKLAQREYALKNNVDLIMWTYDPAQSLNANFNINKLGVINRDFKINYYGEIRDGINIGMPTDRFKVEWWIRSPRVEKRISAGPPKLDFNTMIHDYGCKQAADIESKEDLPCIRTINTNLENYCVMVPIPRDINSIREASFEKALEWRLMLRQLFTYYILEKGYIVVEYLLDKEREVGYYVLVKEQDMKKILENNLPWYH